MTAGYFYAHTVAKAPSKAAKPLTPHTTLPRARAAARKHSKTSKEKSALVLERDAETGLSTLLEHWENGAQTRTKCDDDRWCSFMERAMANVGKSFVRGLDTSMMVADKGGSIDLAVVPIYRTTAREAPMIVNFCPFCGVQVRKP